MFNYCIFEVYHKNGGLYEKIGANFKSRGVKHSQTIIDTYISVYEEKRHPMVTVNSHIYYNATNPAFVPDQLKVYRGKVSGAISRQIAPLNTLKSTVKLEVI